MDLSAPIVLHLLISAVGQRNGGGSAIQLRVLTATMPIDAARYSARCAVEKSDLLISGGARLYEGYA
jgi:hypothetical protein